MVLDLPGYKSKNENGCCAPLALDRSASAPHVSTEEGRRSDLSTEFADHSIGAQPGPFNTYDVCLPPGPIFGVPHLHLLP
jgi:hypothetical protein